ncbi:hypothetical protein FQA39_LY07764 [Lamprigera yunnana]|nr:hypothetical protein FQA39_LY07764 [Lamprigera yunnana]
MNLGGTVHINKKGVIVLICLSLIPFYYLFSDNTPKEINRINLRKLLAVAVRAAEDGGREIVRIRDDVKVESKGKTEEGADDSVTTADYKSHCVMYGNLKYHFPSLTIISEEAGTKCEGVSLPKVDVELDNSVIDDWVNEEDVTVWIDPLDATQEYTEKLYKYVTTMVCVAINGAPIIGIVHKPFFKNTSWAWVGQGSSFASLKLPEGEKLKFIISRSHSGTVKELINNKFREKGVEIEPAGGAGYKVLELVYGNANAYVHITAIKKWDICAGNAILHALGGKMTNVKDKFINYTSTSGAVNENGLIATLKNHQYYINLLQ